MATDIKQFLDRNIAILTASFEVGEADYNERILPSNVVANACRKIDKALQDKKKELMGQESVHQAVKRFEDMVEYLQHGDSNNLEEQKISFQSFPKKWNHKRKRLQDENENENENSESDEEEVDDEEYKANKKTYEQNLRQAIKLEQEIAEAKKKLALYQGLTKTTSKINTKEIVDKSMLTPKSSLSKELEQNEAIAARINKKLAKNPEVLEKLRKRMKATKEEKTANQAAQNLLSKIAKKSNAN